MAGTSPIAALPYPTLTDVSNAQTAFQNLTTALDQLIIPRYGSAATRDATIASPTDGQHAYRTDIHAPEYYHGGAAGYTHGYCLISETTLSGSLSSITFTIPQDFRDLRITTSLRDTTTANSYYNWSLRINGDAAANYATNALFNNNFAASFSTFSSAGTTAPGAGFLAAGSTAGANVWGNGVMEIPFYSKAGAEKNGSFSCSVWNGSTIGAAQTGCWTWAGGAAISSITIFPSGGTALAVGSTIRIYGMG